MGIFSFSLLGFPRMASDSVDDLGIFLNVFCGGSPGC